MSQTRAIIITILFAAVVCFSIFMVVADMFISRGISSGVAALVTVGPITAFVVIIMYWDSRSSRKHDADSDNMREKYAVGNYW